MKKHLLAALFLVLTTVFYFSIIGVLFGLYLLLTKPSLESAVLLGVCVVIVLLYGIAMKLKPGFRKLVADVLENHPPLP
ncbi:MAG: hypothetical protein AAB921_01170 [Patescibacteria group bacterium]